ncbi:MAG: SGNH/GDSL hydrolase family protein [Bacteroidetes bacterium]|nr:SGNH/GDSL hydrolase family protein [Bacteroidota bacterium]
MTSSTPSESSGKPKNKRVFFFYFILIAFFLLMLLIIGALVTEIGLRWSGKYAISGFTLDREVIWRLKPHMCEDNSNEEGSHFELTTNSKGFRGKEWESKKTKKRIMLLGDSYTAALDFPDDQTFAGILQAKLDSDAATKGQYEVINISAPAWSIDQQMLMFEKYAAELRPDYTILMAAPNDVRELFCKKFITSNGAGGIVVHPPDFILKKRVGWYLSERSSLFQYLQEKKFHSNYGTFYDIFEMYTMNFGVHDSTDWDRPLYLKNPMPEVDEAFSLYHTVFKRLKEDCTRQNSKLLVTMIPVQDYVEGHYVPDTLLDQNKVLNYFTGLCAESQLPFLNMYGAATSLQHAPSLYKKHDLHYSSFGNLFTGTQLYAFFKSNM